MGKQNYNWHYKQYPCSSELPVATFSENNWYISNRDIPFLHFHDTLEITYWIEGKGSFQINGAQYPLEAGNICVICPNAMHQSFNRSDDSSRCQYLYVDLERFSIMNHCEYRSLDYLKYHSPQFKCVFTSDEAENLVAILLQIFRETKEQKLNYRAAVLSLTGLLLTQILRYQNIQPSANHRSLANTFSISPALEHINIHFAEDISTSELASLCYMSATNFRRIFQRVMQMSPMEHLNQVRIRKACELLTTTNLSVLEIGERVGFNSVSSFTRNFRSMMQVSPLTWRKEVRLL